MSDQSDVINKDLLEQQKKYQREYTDGTYPLRTKLLFWVAIIILTVYTIAGAFLHCNDALTEVLASTRGEAALHYGLSSVVVLLMSTWWRQSNTDTIRRAMEQNSGSAQLTPFWYEGWLPFVCSWLGWLPFVGNWFKANQSGSVKKGGKAPKPSSSSSNSPNVAKHRSSATGSRNRQTGGGYNGRGGGGYTGRGGGGGYGGGGYGGGGYGGGSPFNGGGGYGSAGAAGGSPYSPGRYGASPLGRPGMHAGGGGGGGGGGGYGYGHYGSGGGGGGAHSPYGVQQHTQHQHRGGPHTPGGGGGGYGGPVGYGSPVDGGGYGMQQRAGPWSGGGGGSAYGGSPFNGGGGGGGGYGGSPFNGGGGGGGIPGYGSSGPVDGRGSPFGGSGYGGSSPVFGGGSGASPYSSPYSRGYSPSRKSTPKAGTGTGHYPHRNMDYVWRQLAVDRSDPYIDTAKQALRRWLRECVLSRVFRLLHDIEKNHLLDAEDIRFGRPVLQPSGLRGVRSFDAIETTVNEICDLRQEAAKQAVLETKQAVLEAKQAKAATAGGGLFGATAPTGGGLFGATAPTGGGLFGTTTTTTATTGSLFGATAALDAQRAYATKVEEAEKLERDIVALKKKLKTAATYLKRWPNERQQQYVRHRLQRMYNADQILWDGDVEFYDQLHIGCDAQRDGQPLPRDFPTDGQLLVRCFVAFMDDGDDYRSEEDFSDGTFGW